MKLSMFLWMLLSLLGFTRTRDQSRRTDTCFECAILRRIRVMSEDGVEIGECVLHAGRRARTYHDQRTACECQHHDFWEFRVDDHGALKEMSKGRLTRIARRTWELLGVVGHIVLHVPLEQREAQSLVAWHTTRGHHVLCLASIDMQRGQTGRVEVR